MAESIIPLAKLSKMITLLKEFSDVKTYFESEYGQTCIYCAQDFLDLQKEADILLNDLMREITK